MIHGFISDGRRARHARTPPSPIAAHSCAALLTKSPHEIRPQDPPWRKNPGRRACRARREARLRRSRRKLSPGARRLARLAGPAALHRLPPGRRRGLHGRGLRQAHRRARRLLRDARPGRDQRRDRRAHRPPGFDADGPVHRPGARTSSPSARRSRRSTTGACSARWRSGWRRSTASSASPNTSPRLPHRDGRAGPARWCSRCPRTCCSPRPRWPTPALPHARGAPAPARRWTRCASCSGSAKQPLRHPRRRRLGRARPAPTCSASPKRNGLPVGTLVPLPGPVRQPQPELRRRRRHRHQSEARAAREGGRPAAGDRRAPGRDDDQRLHAGRGAACRGRSWSMCMPAPRSSAASTRPTLAINCRACRSSCDAPARSRSTQSRWKAETAAARKRISRHGPSRGRSRARCRCGEVIRWLRTSPAATTRSSPTAPATSPAGCTASSATSGFRTQLAPTTGSMGYGVPGGGRGEARRARAHRARALPATATS